MSSLNFPNTNFLSISDLVNYNVKNAKMWSDSVPSSSAFQPLSEKNVTDAMSDLTELVNKRLGIENVEAVVINTHSSVKSFYETMSFLNIFKKSTAVEIVNPDSNKLLTIVKSHEILVENSYSFVTVNESMCHGLNLMTIDDAGIVAIANPNDLLTRISLYREINAVSQKYDVMMSCIGKCMNMTDKQLNAHIDKLSEEYRGAIKLNKYDL